MGLGPQPSFALVKKITDLSNQKQEEITGNRDCAPVVYRYLRNEFQI